MKKRLINCKNISLSSFKRLKVEVWQNEREREKEKKCKCFVIYDYDNNWSNYYSKIWLLEENLTY